MKGSGIPRVLVWAILVLVPLRCGLTIESAFGAREVPEIPEGGAEVEKISEIDGTGLTLERVLLYPQARDGSDDRLVRRGLLYRHKNAKATILMTHGFMCSKEDVCFLRHLFGGDMFNVMTFDFRAHGQYVHEQCCTFGKEEAHDVIAAAEFLKNHPDLRNKPIFAYGFSMGSAALIEAQAKHGGLFDAMVLDCPFDSSETIVRTSLGKLTLSLMGYEIPFPGRSLLQRYAFEPRVQALIVGALKAVKHIEPKVVPLRIESFAPAESIKQVSVPCFLIHCKNDEKVPVDAAYNIFNNAGAAYKKLWVTNGRRHYDSLFYNPDRYIQEVRNFFNVVMSKRVPPEGEAVVIEDPDEDEA